MPMRLRLQQGRVADDVRLTAPVIVGCRRVWSTGPLAVEG